jgi:site-specific DNA-methyltransferase (adenine-specific)
MPIDDGWILRNKIVWHKPNQVPYSQSNGLLDRFNISHEYLFFFTKMKKNYSFTTIYEPSIEGKRIMRDVWSINTEALKGNHPATYPTELVKRCIEAGCPVGGTVLDPFMGSGTTAYVAQQLDRHWIGIELNRDYCVEISNRMRKIGKFL